MRTDTLFDLTAELRALGGGRVWSLMVSLFGDLAQGEGDVIEGPVLSAIMAQLGIKPEAARVALHRLRNDGWIMSQKSGRISLHSLSAEGRAKSAKASPRIYGRTGRGADTSVQLVMVNPVAALPENDMRARGFIPVQPHLFVGGGDLAPPPDAAVFGAEQLPDWLRAVAVPVDLVPSYERLARSLRILMEGLPEPSTLSSLDVAVLRCLVVHNWRRLVLKHAVPPAGLIDQDGAYHRCQGLVGEVLNRFERPALSAII